MITKSDNLCLRYYRVGDEEALFEYTSDVEASMYLARKPHEIECQTTEMLRQLSVPTGFSEFGKCIWVIASVSNQQALGYLTLIEKEDAVELHVGIVKKYSGKGNATNAIKLACEYLLEMFKYKEIVSFTDVEHLAAQAVFQKAGFRVIKRIQKYYIAPSLDGKRDVYWLRYSA